MLPSILARQLQKGICDYVTTTFPMTNEPFKGSLERMISKGDYLYHEPYISVRLPFRKAEEMPTCFEAVKPDYLPYVHQAKAFERISGDKGKSTLVATGTGSGKTECFLYPVLEYCWQHRGERGIKALLIYPMNALATDQARRLASLIYNNDKLRGNVSAGMYIGGMDKKASTVMTEDKIITDRTSMQNTPPDILLTNYKMLDYLLVRPKDAAIWSENKDDTLKYVVVDEFHTFDGAQGTDLACLLRRLKKRLNTPKDYLCCVGTSATMGDEESNGKIRKYATEVFGETFDEDAIITEDRLSPDQFFDGCEVTDFKIPEAENAKTLDNFILEDEEPAYLEMAAGAWLTDFTEDLTTPEGRIALGHHLMHHGFFQAVIREMKGQYVQVPDLIERLQVNYPDFPAGDEGKTLMDALFALVSEARNEGGRPFLDVKLQLWIRELRRLVAKVDPKEVTYAFAHDLNEEQADHFLPAVNCRECGATGWAALPHMDGQGQSEAMGSDLSLFYNQFFSGSRELHFLYPCREGDTLPIGMKKGFLCPNCLHFDDWEEGETSKVCSHCHQEMMPVFLPDLKNRKDRFLTGSGNHSQYVCPYCGSKRGFALMGIRSATEISACLSQMFASRFNDDRKLLAFSDNVQDAAQRAGFFNARTWRSGLRIAIQDYVNHGGDGLSLKDFKEGFVEYWKQKISREQFVSTFIAPNMVWMKAYDDMIQSGSVLMDDLGKRMLSGIEKRLKYEILLEYGLTSRIGRTLEKSGCSTLVIPSKDVLSAARYVWRKIQKDDSLNDWIGQHQITKEIINHMTAHFLNLFRMNGAFMDEAFDDYFFHGGKNFFISSGFKSWRPSLQAGRNVPHFLAVQSGYGQGTVYFDHKENEKYWKTILSVYNGKKDDKLIALRLEDFLLEALCREGLLTTKTVQNYVIYGLNEEKCMISSKVRQMRCPDCGMSWSVAEEDKSLWKGSACLNESCEGHFDEDKEAGLDYYGKLYSNGVLCRIHAKEHTGLLERNDREELEKSFKRKSKDRMPWDPNVLSCTPTLEMGIDIGDLDTVALCSIPPAQSQFFQRTGRAGRKDGNALTLAVANATPHDLYFYADPMEMIAGEVMPPKIFLNAFAVLQRQFVAYCMDSWVKEKPDEAAGGIPDSVAGCLVNFDKNEKDYKLGSMKVTEKNRFPFNYLYYIQDNLSRLKEGFLEMFAPDMEKKVQDEISTFAEGNEGEDKPSIQIFIFKQFEELLKQRNGLKKNIKALKDFQKELKSRPKDISNEEDIKQTADEIKTLQKICRELEGKNVFQFMSDEGLLPNYAFPESGVILKAVFTRKEKSTDKKTDDTPESPKAERFYEEYNRAAASAISEFAPDNTFYAGGHKMTVDQIDLTTSPVSTWRLCPNCSHAELEDKVENKKYCPICGNPGWADEGQVVNMIQAKTVYAHADWSSSLIGDDQDSRNSKFYFRQLLVDINEKEDVIKAYEMDNKEFPFGYEFVKNAKIREINFGPMENNGTRTIVDGKEAVRQGFRICKYCGCVQKPGQKENHRRNCIVVTHPESEKAQDPFMDCMYLYREIKTEALRILIPSTSAAVSEMRKESFAAAFMLGMQEYFGNVDHLRASIMDMPSEEGVYRKNYLVVYDSVPGGTGYLQQLMNNKDSLIQIFQKALDKMENCSCNQTDGGEDKDGCYHCLFAYRQSRNIGNISRNEAEKMLRAILSGKDNIQEIPGLGHIQTNTLFDSELEKQFVEAISRCSSDNLAIRVSSILVNGKEGYLVKLGHPVKKTEDGEEKTVIEYTTAWEIEPQVDLDEKDGVDVKCRPDFIIRLLSSEQDNDPRLPVAVFTDGFKYHQNRVDDDTLKREAIHRSGKYRVWSLSYQDVQDVMKRRNDTVAHATPVMPLLYKTFNRKRFDSTLKVLSPNTEDMQGLSSFDLLIRYLADPATETDYSALAKTYGFTLLTGHSVTNRAVYAPWKSKWMRLNEQIKLDTDDLTDGTVYFNERKIKENEDSNISIYSFNSLKAGKDLKKLVNPYVLLLLEDREGTRTETYERDWNGFWQFANLMQFMPHFMAASMSGFSKSEYYKLGAANEMEVTAAGEPDNGWKEIIENLFDESSIHFAKSLQAMKIPVPDPDTLGDDVEDDHGKVVGMMEMGWPAFKVCLVLPDEADAIPVLEKQGWTVLSVDSEIDKNVFGGK